MNDKDINKFYITSMIKTNLKIIGYVINYFKNKILYINCKIDNIMITINIRLLLHILFDIHDIILFVR